MEYNEVIEYILQMEKFGIKLGLSNITKFLSYIGNPQESYPMIHVAGTNGKGSTVAIMEAILMAAGYRVGVYTSPHLVDFRERIKINGRLIDKKYITDFFNNNLKKIESLPITFFETVTALAFAYFKDEKVDVALIEAGMGGRLDATNVITPKVTIITNVETEHTKWLGFKVRQIAFEKAGIIKPGIPVVTAAQNFDARHVIRQVCQQNKCKLVSIFDETQWVIKSITRDFSELDIFTRSNKYYNLKLALPGRHQMENSICALIGVELFEQETGLKSSSAAVATGFRTVKWDGRLQRISESPEIILDVAHNPAAMTRIREYFKEFYQDKKIIAVFGILSDKDYHKMLKELDGIADVIILTRPMTERAADPNLLIDDVAKITTNFQVIPMVRDALQSAKELCRPDEIILVTGSHYTVGEVLANLP
ncbi:MAG TPA: bifunctional folylpolyglutamate synthase/dihydrofolate synthase [candidate division Zixibacteria bacterium]|nr:bifunctional folylpolyglutamate synthase/dihydrofolate synthase [candidate division Zixibacteria bacterium]